MRVAAIDIGTNSTLLLVVERDSTGTERVLVDRATVTRLGQGVDQTRQLAPEAVARTLDCLEAYAATLRELGVERLRVVGTSALRDVGNAHNFNAAAARILGVAPQVIDGNLEAQLTFRGALSGLAVTGQVVVVDIGGGSTEVIVGRVEAQTATALRFASVDVGCVRLTERHMDTDPPSASALSAVAASTRAALGTLGFKVAGGTLVAVAGTATTLAAMHLELAAYRGDAVHGCTLERRDVSSLVDGLSRVAHTARARLRGLEPRRADVIVAGSVMLSVLLDHFGYERVIISDRGVRFGLVETLFNGAAVG